jgi:hypothetical protein
MVVTDSLSAHRCFKTLDPEARRVLDRRCTWFKAAAGAWIVVRKAEDGDVYFVMAGRLRPALHGMRRDLMSSEIKAASFFGELGALKGLPGRHGVFALGAAAMARLAARNRAMNRRVAAAAHIYEGCLPLVGPMGSPPRCGRFHAGADVRHIGPQQRRA